MERFGNMTRIYYKETTGVFVTIDSNRSSTVDASIKWKNDLDDKLVLPKLKSSDRSPIILLISKVDLLDEEDKAKINYDEFCEKHGFHSRFMISSKTGEGIESACNKMVEILQDIEEIKKEEPKKILVSPKPVEEPKSFFDNIYSEVNDFINSRKNPPIQENKSVDNPNALPSNHIELFFNFISPAIYEKKNAGPTEMVIRLKEKFHWILFKPHLLHIREQIKQDENFRKVVYDIYDLLVDESTTDSIKIDLISNYILKYGKKSCF
jgi:hypothetical protein